MPEPFGVVPTGFSRKTLAEILADVEAENIAIFGAGVVQEARSPLGQLNGLFADQAAEYWEVVEDTYQSFDVDQAEFPRMDMLAKLRRLTRHPGESDADFRLRITNQGQANIKLVENVNRLRALPGVTWAAARENRSATTDGLGIPSHSVAYAAIGGDDGDIGKLVYQFSAPGVGLYGNTEVTFVADGYCQHTSFIRPVDVPIVVNVLVRQLPDNCNCAPPTVGAIAQHIVDAFAGECGHRNGDAVLLARIKAEAQRLPGIEVLGAEIYRKDDPPETGDPALDEIEINLFERAVIFLPDVTVIYDDV